MKKLVIPALFAALALSGCASAPAASESTLDTVPRPDEAQRAALTKSLGEVAPELSGPRSVAGAVSMCRLIRKGAPETEQATAVSSIFRLDHGKPLTLEQRDRVLTAIKSNGFCTMA
jgi:hypothetical protein